MDALLDFIRTDMGSPGLATLLVNPKFAFIQLDASKNLADLSLI